MEKEIPDIQPTDEQKNESQTSNDIGSRREKKVKRYMLRYASGNVEFFDTLEEYKKAVEEYRKGND